MLNMLIRRCSQYLARPTTANFEETTHLPQENVVYAWCQQNSNEIGNFDISRVTYGEEDAEACLNYPLRCDGLVAATTFIQYDLASSLKTSVRIAMEKTTSFPQHSAAPHLTSICRMHPCIWGYQSPNLLPRDTL